MPGLRAEQILQRRAISQQVTGKFLASLAAKAPFRSRRALDWPATRTTSGFVSGTVFWAVFLMPAVARSLVYGPLCGQSFGATETPLLGTMMSAPIIWITCWAALCSHPCDQICFPCSSSGFRVALRTPKLERCTFRALYHEACLVSGMWAKLLNSQRWLCPAPPKWLHTPTGRTPGLQC